MIGTQIGHLQIIRKLGEGGMGAVYLAQHQVLSKRVVVKVLLPRWSQDATLVQRFVNEARAATAIEHRSIINVDDCGQLPDGTWYIVMAYLDGGSLDGFLRSQGGPISMHLALELLAPAAEGLDEAHKRNIIHCDLKPENIYLIQREKNPHHPVVLDFGIAKLGDKMSGLQTAAGTIAGTLTYMAPEQIYDRRTVDRRSDVYALGVIVYQMVTGGWLPYQREDDPAAFFELAPTAIYELQKHAAVIPPQQRGAQISVAFAGAILAALQFEPARRPATAGAFMRMLADGVPGDGFQPGGVEILKEYAPKLLEIDNLQETLRAPRGPGSASRVGSRYHLGPKLGEGGMAEVFRATMTGAEGFSRTVAIKRILPALSTMERFSAMFVQEAQLASRLSHPNVVTVLDFDRNAEGQLFLVLEFVDGVDLGRLMETGPIPHAVTIFLASEICSGLGHAHELPASEGVRGMVHRDVSPNNVLLSWQGAVKVSDFGLAKARDASEVSGSLALKGKPAYMSPEQVNGQPLDGRSDLFAIGIVLWELLTGRRLFGMDDTKATLASVMYRSIPRPSVIRPVPADLEAVVMRLLERSRLERYATAAHVVDALAECRDASTRGRAELMRLLAERFPKDAAMHASRHSLLREPPPMDIPAPASSLLTRSHQGTIYVPSTRPSKPTTLSSAAGESRPSRSRTRWFAGGALATVAAVVAFLAVRTPRDRADLPPTVREPAHQGTGPAATTGTAGPAVNSPMTPTPLAAENETPDAGLPDAAAAQERATSAGTPRSAGTASSVSPPGGVKPRAPAPPALQKATPAAKPARTKANTDDVGGD